MRVGASALYGHLAKAVVRIHEYCERPLHAKVALVDGHWATVGSSNLDPLSLSLNLEANLVVRDAGFNAVLHAELDRLMRESCRRIDTEQLQAQAGLGAVLRSAIAFHLVRLWPRMAGWLPRHRPQLAAAMQAHERLTPACAVSQESPP